MDAVEFIQAHERLLVDIVRKWTAEHCEVSKADESRNVLELMVALTDKVDRMAERIKVAENMIEESRCVMDAAFGEVDERFAEVDKRIALCMQMNGGKRKKKRTRMDVLVEAFPEAVCDAHGVPCACPRDFGLTKCGGGDCVECRHEHWCAEVGD